MTTIKLGLDKRVARAESRCQTCKGFGTVTVATRWLGGGTYYTNNEPCPTCHPRVAAAVLKAAGIAQTQRRVK